MGLNKYRVYSKGKMDGWLLLAVLILSFFGLIMVASASVVLSHKFTGGNYYFVTQQAIHLTIGIIAMIVFSAIDYRIWRKMATWILIMVFVLLIITLIMGSTVKGANSWIVFGSFNFQPSEVVKLFVIIYLAAWLSSKREKLNSIYAGFAPFALIIGSIATLIFLQPDAGTTLVILATAVTMYFVAGAPWSHLIFGLVAGLSLLIPAIISKPYRLQRILVLFNPSDDTLGAAYHINQALLAVGSGGLIGLGFGNSKQKFLYLPEPHNDSIFAIAVEELGFLRAILIFVVIVLIVLRGLKIAKDVKDEFGKLLAVGISGLIAIQAFVNIGAILGITPLTGVTLPFVSYGGTSLVMLFISMGILLNISKYKNV